MPAFAKTRRVRHSANDMFALVADIEAYPEFVPLCERLVVRSRKEEAERTLLTATLTVAYKFLRESFTSRVTLDRPGMIIRAEYIEGPFRHLENIWRFEAADAGNSLVHFAIDYEFRSRTFAALMGAVFDRAFRKFADAFEARANAVYGADGRQSATAVPMALRDR